MKKLRGMEVITPAAYQKLKETKKRNNEEHKTQAAYIVWFSSQYPQYRKLLTAIPNGGNRSPVTGAILKREGCSAGWPDVQFMLPRNGFSGLFIEFKNPNGKVSENQAEIIEALRGAGYMAVVVYNLSEAMIVTNVYLTS